MTRRPAPNPFRPLLPLLLASALLAPPAPARGAEGATLEAVQRHLQRGEFARAKAVARALVAADPADETAWLMFEAVIRQETRREFSEAPAPAAPEPGAPVAPEPPGPAPEPPRTAPGRPADGAGLSNPYEAAADPAPAGDAPHDPAGDPVRQGPAGSPRAEEDLFVDFRSAAAESGISVALGEGVARSAEEGLVFPAKTGGTIALTFDLKRFPRGAKLELSHRVEGKGGLARMAPLQVIVNDKPLFIRKVPVKTRAAESSWPCTDHLKAGANVVQISVADLPVRYFLKGLRVRRER